MARVITKPAPAEQSTLTNLRKIRLYSCPRAQPRPATGDQRQRAPIVVGSSLHGEQGLLCAPARSPCGSAPGPPRRSAPRPYRLASSADSLYRVMGRRGGEQGEQVAPGRIDSAAAISFRGRTTPACRTSRPDSRHAPGQPLRSGRHSSAQRTWTTPARLRWCCTGGSAARRCLRCAQVSQSAFRNRYNDIQR